MSEERIQEYFENHQKLIEEHRNFIKQWNASSATLRDLFAMSALPEFMKQDTIKTVSEAADAAYYVADAMLKARSKTND
jgi:hypothetical protein